MNKLILSTGSDSNYLSKIEPYLESILSNSNFDDNVLVYLSDNDVDSNNPKINVANISPLLISSPNKNNCLQHGEFLKSKYFDKYDNNDVIFFTDGDMILQRELTENEQNVYRSLNNGDVYVGYNASPDDTLYDESFRLGKSNIMFPEFDFDWKNIKVYNTGVLGMNKETWLRLINDYQQLFPKVDQMFNHYAKQQWLISFIIGTMNYNIIEMPYEIHNHRHYPSPIGTTQDLEGNVFYNNKKVLFKHRW
jgi:hypothetical protein